MLLRQNEVSQQWQPFIIRQTLSEHVLELVKFLTKCIGTSYSLQDTAPNSLPHPEVPVQNTIADANVLLSYQMQDSLV